MPTLTLAEERLFAWQGPFDPCETCEQTRNHRCRTASGNLTPPHKPRLDAVRYWLARQPEIDALTTEVDNLVSALETAEAAREDAMQDAAGYARLLDQEKTAHTETRTVAAQQIKDLRDEVERVSQLSKSQAADLEFAAQSQVKLLLENERLKARIAKLENPTPAPTTLFGAGGGNVDRTKDDIDIDRWYGGPNDIDKAVTRIKANAAEGILSWVSFKLPHPWVEMNVGKGDTWGANIYAKLRALNTPVWVAFHHEPENDQPDEKEWTKFQLRFARMLGDGGIDGTGKVKYTLIFTGWHQIKGTDLTLKFDAMYPVGAPVYLLAIDYPYLPYGYKWTKTSPNTKTTELDTGFSTGLEYVAALKAAGEKYGVKVGIAECGWSDEAFVKYPDWLGNFLRSCADLAAVVYYDTLVNSSKSWWLGPATSPKRAHFYAALAAARRLS